MGGELDFRDRDYCGEDRVRERQRDRLTRGDSGGKGAGRRHGLNDRDHRDRCRCWRRRIERRSHHVPAGRGAGRGGERDRDRDQGDVFRDMGDDPRVFGNVRGTNAGQVGEGGLNHTRILGPARDAVLDVLGKSGVLAVAIALCIIGARGQGDPGIQALGQNRWCWYFWESGYWRWNTR